MSPILRVLESTRVYLLVFTLPPALVWFGFGGTGEDVAFGLASPLLVVAYSLLVLFHVTSFDAATLAWGGVPRLGMTGNRDHWDPDLVDRARVAYAALIGLVSAVLLVALAWRPMLVILVSLILVGTLTGGADRASRKWRMMFAEVLWPALMLIVPMILAGLLLGSRGGLASVAPAVTGLFALLLAGYVALCLIRDEALDFGEGQRTVATVLGRGGASVVMFLLVSALLVVACRGVSQEWWGWSVGAVCGVAGAGSMWGISARDGEGLPLVWVIGSVVVALAVLLG